MDILSSANSLLDGALSVIGTIRSVIEKGLSLVNLNGMNFVVFWIISIFCAYLFLKQFIISGWAKISTLLNLALLALIFYIMLTRVA